MKELLDRNITLRIMLVDSDDSTAGRLSVALSRLRSRIGHGLDIETVGSIKKAYDTLSLYKPNVIFIDLVSTHLRDSITFIQHVRISHPHIVFVLYCHEAELEVRKSEIYSGWGARLKHYFLLDKALIDSEFESAGLYNLVRAQLDLYTYGAQDSLNQTVRESGPYSLTKTQLSKLQTQVVQLSRQLQNMQKSIVTSSTNGEMRQGRKRAFVIMSFAEDLQDVYEIGIKEFLTNEYSVDVFRMDECYPNGLIIQRVYEEIHNSTVIIAELTHAKPNCYYELGFAEALGKPVIRMAKSGTDLPFDVNQYPFLLYSSLADLRPRLKDALEDLEVLKG